MPYYVYVISLKVDVLEERKFIQANPDYVAGKPCYYVGSTSLTPKKRAEQHRTQYRNAKGTKLWNDFACDYFDGLRPRQFDRYNPISTRAEAEKTESEIAQKLRNKGCGVWSN